MKTYEIEETAPNDRGCFGISSLAMTKQISNSISRGYGLYT